ncbi:MAG: SPFH domain-containing protein [Anaerorhabdus sp.]
MNKEIKENNITNGSSGWIGILSMVLGVSLGIYAIIFIKSQPVVSVGLIVAIIFVLIIGVIFIASGLKIIKPNEAAVYTLFGQYYGTIKEPGFYWTKPFTTEVRPGNLFAKKTDSGSNMVEFNINLKRMSLKANTLSNEKQKVNDCAGNPIEIGVIVIWKVVDPNKAVFEVDDYKDYISTQADGSIRQIARQYPYDVADDNDDEKTLRGSSQEVATELKREIQQRVEFAGIEIIEARISHLAYAPEIAAAMLQRQQATAIIAARQKIVEGAVSMVQMALEKLEDENIVEMDAERKAQMVSNLLVILCGNKEAQPIVNSGSIY